MKKTILVCEAKIPFSSNQTILDFIELGDYINTAYGSDAILHIYIGELHIMKHRLESEGEYQNRIWHNQQS